MMINSAPEFVFGEQLNSLEEFLSFLDRSNLSMCIPAFNQLVREAIVSLECGPSGHEKDLDKFQYRRSSFKELQYICDGDSHKVLYFACTSYGEHQLVHPVLSKKVTIAASSPFSRFTDPEVLVSRSYQGTSFAGLLMEDGRNTAWWMVDIGHNHQDIMTKIMNFAQQGPRAVCLVSGSGTVSNVTIQHPKSSWGFLTYEGLFEILSLSGSFTPTEVSVPQFSRSGMMTITLSGADGRAMGGLISGLITAATTVKQL